MQFSDPLLSRMFEWYISNYSIKYTGGDNHHPVYLMVYSHSISHVENMHVSSVFAQSLSY